MLEMPRFRSAMALIVNANGRESCLMNRVSSLSGGVLIFVEQLCKLGIVLIADCCSLIADRYRSED